MNSRTLSAVLGLLIAAVHVVAQTKSDTNPRRGLQATGSYLIGEIETLSLTNGNLMLSIPLSSLPRNPVGNAHPLTLIYNSKIWEPATVDISSGGQNFLGYGIRRSSDGGWRYGIGYELELRRREGLSTPAPCDGPGDLLYPYLHNYKLRMVFPDGSKHLLRLSTSELEDGGDGYYRYGPDGKRSQFCTESTTMPGTGPLVYYTTDNTYARLEVQRDNDENPLNNPWTLYLKDGTRVDGGNDPATFTYRPQRICDRNSNCVSLEYFVSFDQMYVTSVKDDFNRQITVANGGPAHNPSTDTITAKGFNSADLISQVDWSYGTSRAEDYACGDGTAVCSEYVNDWSVVTIHLPSQANLPPYGFEYNARWGELSKVTLPSGAAVAYTYFLDSIPTAYWDQVPGNYPSQKVVSYTDELTGGAAPAETSTLTLNQTPTAYGFMRYTSSVSIGADGSTTTTHFYPYDYAGTSEWNSGLVYRIENPDGSVTQKTWTQNDVPNATSPLWENYNAYVSSESRTLTRMDSGGPATYTSSKTYSQDRNGNLLSVNEYDWSTGTSPLLRTTTTAYYLGTSGAPTLSQADGYWNPGVGCGASACILNLPKSSSVIGNANASQDDFCYDGAGNLTNHARLKQGVPSGPLITCATGALASNAIGSRFVYGPKGILQSSFDGRGVETRNVYDAENLYVTDKYDAYGTPVQRHWHYQTDRASGRVTLEQDADNSTSTTTDYDVFGRPISVTDPAKTVTTEYGDAGRYVKTVAADATLSISEIVNYDQLGRVVLTRRSDERGAPIALAASDGVAEARGIKVERRYQNLTDGRYEFVSNPYRSATDATLGWTRRKYDGAGRLVEEATFAGGYPVNEANLTGKTTIAYNGHSHTIKDQAANATMADNPGSTRTLTLDAAGRIAQVVEAISGGNQTTSYTYDSLDNLSTVTQGSQNRTFIYDPLGRLASANNPETGLIGYQYDDAGNLIQKTDARAVTTVYGRMVSGTCTTSVGYDASSGYDALHRAGCKSYSDGTPAVTLSYDADLAISDQQHPEVSLPNYPKGRLVQAANSASSTVYRYDAAGRVQSSAQTTAGNTYVFGYGYNWMGLTSLRYPSTRLVSYAYDAGARVQQVGSYASSIQYAAHGAVQQMALGNSTYEETCYNTRLQPLGIRVGPAASSSACANPGTDLLNLAFGYGPAASNNGNLLSQTIAADGKTFYQSYGYHPLNRLAWVSEGANWSRGFGYDDLHGNMWVTSATGIPADSFTPTTSNWYDVNNRLVNAGLGIHHDAAGNLDAIGAFSWSYDAENRLATSTFNSVTTKYSYDGEGRRVKKAIGEQTTVYVYDAQGQLAAEYSSSPQTVPCATCYLTADHLGSTRMVTDSGGAVKALHDFLPFGEEVPAGIGGRSSTHYPASTLVISDAVNQKFTGKERDAETGLDYFGARYLSAAQGRFTSPDWSAVPRAVPYATFEDPQTLNLYAYVRNNPLRLTDADGHGFWTKLKNWLTEGGWNEDEEAEKVRYANRVKVARQFFTANQVTLNGQAVDPTRMSDRQVLAAFKAFNDDWRNLIAQGEDHPLKVMHAATRIDWNAQEKHFPGHNSYQQGRSILTADPRRLLEKVGTGKALNDIPVGQPGSRERIDFGQVIGAWVDERTGQSAPTTKGIVHYSKEGIHIVPARP